MPNGHPQRLPGPERIAHRGAPRELDENTLEGFLRAVERGADAVELDVHATRDGVVVVHHDPDVALQDGTRMAISGLTQLEVSAVRLSRGGRIPTLAAVMDAMGDRAMVYVELKGTEVGGAAVEVAHRHGSRYAFHSFDHETVFELRMRWPELRYGLLLDAGTPNAARAASAPVTDVWAHWSLVDEDLVRAMHAAGKRLIAWTVNDPAVARRFAALRIDGMCTDDVRLLDLPPG